MHLWILEMNLGQNKTEINEKKALIAEFNAKFGEKSIDFNHPTFQPVWMARINNSLSENNLNLSLSSSRGSVEQPEQVDLRPINQEEYSKIRSQMARRRVPEKDIPKLPNNMIRLLTLKRLLDL